MRPEPPISLPTRVCVILSFHVLGRFANGVCLLVIKRKAHADGAAGGRLDCTGRQAKHGLQCPRHQVHHLLSKHFDSGKEPVAEVVPGEEEEDKKKSQRSRRIPPEYR